MCELKVINKIGKKEKKVGEDIVYAKTIDDYILLKDVLGSEYKVDNALIEEVNINAETLYLISSPLITKLRKFLDVCNKCESKEIFSKEVVSLWEEIKTSGDKVVNRLWKNYGGK